MIFLRACLFSPAIMLVVTIITVVVAKVSGHRMGRIRNLVGRTILYAFVGALLTLAYTIGWMVWYERATGYSAGNAPIGWIFFYGPGGAALGQLIALVHWWIRRPHETKLSNSVA